MSKKKKNRGLVPAPQRPPGALAPARPAPGTTTGPASGGPPDRELSVSSADTAQSAVDALDAAANLVPDASDGAGRPPLDGEDVAAGADAARGTGARIAMTARDEATVRDLVVRLNAARTALEREREQFRKLKETESRIADQERQLRQRELNAEHGFTEQNRAALAQFEGEITTARTELAELRSTIRQERAEAEAHRRTAAAAVEAEERSARAAYHQELERWRAEAEAGERRRTEALEARETELAARERAARRDRQEVETARLLLNDDRAALEQRVGRLVDFRVNAVNSELEARIAERDSARQDRDRLQELLRLRAEADAKFGDRSVEDVLHALKTLEAEVADLQRQLRLRPSELVLVRNKQLEAEREASDNLIAELRIANAQLESQGARNRVAVTELEAIRDERRALAKANELLKAALEELKVKVDQYVERADSQTVFPALAALDGSAALQEPPARLFENFSDLQVFAGGIRQRIARDPDGPLFYEERDIRSFLGGLAMSRLHILQGISGTGKTSLPIAFARALGAGTQLVEVQAGWRDRQDLIGHYNAFERRYYETEFLQAIYKAQTPAYADRLFVIVLDEMNLSRPEQYFADLLSALEQTRDRRRLTLMPAPSHQAPRHLLDGRLLPIPANVWFVGTANHDETTAEFADKTYDRAHIMELPHRPQPFEPKTLGDRPPVSSIALQSMFSDVQKEFADDASRVLELLDKVLARPMAERFGISWANRLKRQVEDYVPVVVAAGGTTGEAADDLVAMKVLRKLRHRHDTQLGDVTSLRAELLSGWTRVMRGSATPDRSVAILDGEIRRLRGADVQPAAP